MTDPKSVFLEFMHRLLAGNLEGALELLGPDIVVHEPAGLPYGGEFHGHDGFRELQAKMHDYWETMAGDGDIEFVVDGDQIVVIGALRGTVRATGKELVMPVMERHLVRGGKIVESWPFYYCSLAMRNAALA